MKMKSAKYHEAMAILPDDLVPVFEELLEHYQFAALKHHGRPWASPLVIAELIIMGWRNTEEYRESKEATESL